MAYRLNAGERVPVAIARVIQEDLDSAISGLEQGRAKKKRDTTVHEARKSIKKVRGVLRLIQPEIGRHAYRKENGGLREIANTLSDLRDATAMVEVFNDLLQHRAGELEKSTVLALRQHLLREKHKIEQSFPMSEVFAKVIRALQAARTRLSALPLKEDGWSAIAPGFKRSFAKGRRALRVVQDHGTSENFHQWRKRVKDHWYHVRLLEQVAADDTRAYERSLKDLETWLGDDHNLAVLREKLGSYWASQGSKEGLESFTRVADSYAQDLRSQALDLGVRVYGPKPKRVTKDFARLWTAREEQAGKDAGLGITRKSTTSAKIVHHSLRDRAS